MRIFGSERMDGMLQKLGLKEGEAIIHPWINKALEKAQQKVEARNFDIRKNLLKFDDVMNDQRKVDLRAAHRADGRRKIVTETVADMRHEVIDDLVAKHIPEKRLSRAVGRRPACTTRSCEVLDLDLPVAGLGQGRGHRRRGGARAHRPRRRRAGGRAHGRASRPTSCARSRRPCCCRRSTISGASTWSSLDHLRQVIGFRGYAQRDPLNEYKTEAFELFEALLTQPARGGDRARSCASRSCSARRRWRRRAISRRCEATPSRSGHRRERDADRRRRQASSRCATRATPLAPAPWRPQIDPNDPDDLGQGPAQRPLPLRLRQEVQALPRPPGLTPGRVTPRPASAGRFASSRRRSHRLPERCGAAATQPDGCVPASFGGVEFARP